MGSVLNTLAAAAWTAGLIAGLGAAACGGTAAPVEHPKASAEVSSLRIFIKNEAKAESVIQAAVEAQLTQAGLQLVAERDADVIGTLRVQKTEKAGFLKIVRNGQPVVNYNYVVTVQLAGGGSVIDVATTEFTGEANEVDGEKIAALAGAVAGSDKLKRHSLRLKSQRAAAATEAKQAEEDRKVKDAQAEKESKEKAEALAWVDADAAACREPAGIDACKKLELYVAKFPEGQHAVEGKAILSGAAPKLEKLREDDSAWKKAGAAACVPGASVDDCAGVEIYLVKYPAGLHSDEARNTLKKAKGKTTDESSASRGSLAEHLAFLKKIKAKPGPYFQRGQKAIRETRKRNGHTTNLQFKRQEVVIACLSGKWVYTHHEYTWRNQMNYAVDDIESVVHLEDGTSTVSSGLLPRGAENSEVQAQRLDKLCAEINP
ncbi:MAG: hypothetical protein IT348_11115 [Candidatus Eisenbacteria bacterium]|nr:hypothetical protein [Candidatus Eisenbacteria bacterium]